MNYYKITNEKEAHGKMKYKTGLNVDIKPFHPGGNCSRGGIYFSREDILTFLGYGPWIRKVTIPEDARVYENPGKPKKWKANRVILGERRRIDVEVIRELIEEGANPKSFYSYALRWASGRGYLDIVKLLLPVSNSEVVESEALRLSLENKYIEVAKAIKEYIQKNLSDKRA